MDRYHSGLLILSFVFLTLFLLSKNTTKEFQNELEIVQESRNELIKTIKKNEIKIDLLTRQIQNRDTLIKQLNQIRKSDNEVYHERINNMRLVTDSAIFVHLAKRYINEDGTVKYHP